LFFLELKDKKGAGEMTEKFTPGEWFVECENEVNTEQKNICRCIRLAMEPEEIAANAALIAAAPEMYRMLKYLADGVRYGGIQHTDRSLAAEIENLLKKARGEE
jgi:hypothetical protein